jgi:hypothetical protein
VYFETKGPEMFTLGAKQGCKKKGKTGRGISRVRWDLKMDLVLWDDKGTCSERRMGGTEKKWQ